MNGTDTKAVRIKKMEDDDDTYVKNRFTGNNNRDFTRP